MTSNIEAAFKREYADIVNALEKKLYDYISIDRAIYVVSCYIRNKSSRDKNKSNNYLYKIMLHGIQIKRMFDKNKNSDVRYYYEIIRSDLKKIKLENCNKTLLKNTSDIFCKILSLRVEGIHSYYLAEFSFWHNLKLVNFLDPNNKNFIKIIKKFTEKFLSYKRYDKYSFNICFKDFYRLKKISFTSQDIINRINEIDEHVIKIKTLDARINQIREELNEYEKLNQYETIYKRVLELYDTELYELGSLIYYHIKSLACIGKHKEAFNLMVEKNTPDYDCFKFILNTNDTDLIYEIIKCLKKLIRRNTYYLDHAYCRYLSVAHMKLGHKDIAIKYLKLIIDDLKNESDKKDRDYYIKILKKVEKQKIEKTQKNEIAVSQTVAKSENKIIDLKTCSFDEIMSLDGFNEEKANSFIQQRENGIVWYDIDRFVQGFNLQPHEMILIQNKIVFPPKPKVKYVRKLDL